MLFDIPDSNYEVFGCKETTMKMTLFVTAFLSVGAFSAIVLSLFFLFFPKVLVKMNEIASKAILNTEEAMLKYRIGFGLLLLLSGLFLAYIVYSTPIHL
jgi:hypothetical protein